jgi:lysophospholipase L1-like esterase
LGAAPGSKVTPADELTVDYRYSLRRLDSRIRTAEGEVVLREGKPHLTVPLPPPLKPGETRLANLFIDYHSDGTDADEFPLLESADQATTATTPGRIPKTMAKIRAGRPVKIVCWGDSVTVGGDASKPETRYPAVFERRLKAEFPAAGIHVETIAVGGSNSRQWLWPRRFPGRPGCDWQRVADAKPDLVTLEFVNDSYMSPPLVGEVYGEILNRLGAMQAEVILITPHFVMPPRMGLKSLREPDRRPYVLALRRFAHQRGVALADASARWEHLWKEGLPYVTLLPNGINHPDDRGHALFAEELMKCFGQ